MSFALPPHRFSKICFFRRTCIYRVSDIYLNEKFFKNFFVRINVEGQKFLPEVGVNPKKITKKIFWAKNVCHMCANHVICFETTVWYPESEFLQYYWYIWSLNWLMSTMNLPRWRKLFFFKVGVKPNQKMNKKAVFFL